MKTCWLTGSELAVTSASDLMIGSKRGLADAELELRLIINSSNSADLDNSLDLAFALVLAEAAALTISYSNVSSVAAVAFFASSSFRYAIAANTLASRCSSICE